jgi:hypothetical protein
MLSLFRWVPKEYAESAKESNLMSHHGSAMWVFDLKQAYRPGAAISRNAILLAYDLDDTAEINITTRQHINFESQDFDGEAAHPAHVIVKANEPGAYGIGRQRQGATKFHTKVRYATKKEVAKALGLKEIEVADGYKPPGGWPH